MPAPRRRHDGTPQNRSTANASRWLRCDHQASAGPAGLAVTCRRSRPVSWTGNLNQWLGLHWLADAHAWVGWIYAWSDAEAVDRI